MICKNGSKEYRELLPGVKLQTLVHGEKTLMGRFEVAKDAKIPPHKHEHEQTGLLLSGKLLLTIDGEEHAVDTGDSWCIYGGSEHSVIALDDSVVVEVFSPVRKDYIF